MEKRLKKYINYIDSQLKNNLSQEDKKILKENFLIQIQFFQHERLIHLIVTVTFALLTIMSILCSLFFQSIPLYVLIVLLLALLFPYIKHYYVLENGVQKLYTYYDQL